MCIIMTHHPLLLVILILIMDFIFYLWLPIIILALASLLKISTKNKGNKKPWIRIEETKENE